MRLQMLYFGLRPAVVVNSKSPSWACFSMSAKNRKVVQAENNVTNIHASLYATSVWSWANACKSSRVPPSDLRYSATICSRNVVYAVNVP